MMALHFYKLHMIYAMWVLPVIAILYIYAAHRRKVALSLFAQTGLIARIKLSASPGRRFARVALTIFACALIVFSCMRPAWGSKPREIKRYGRDVAFVVDVSKSMLAEDLAMGQSKRPSRLERTKNAIDNCVSYIRGQGDRVALIAFAGIAEVKCPLTMDYGFFRERLDSLSPKSVSRGGTMIGKAMNKVLDEVFRDREKKYKDIILITDGEDHGSFPKKAAKEAGDRGIRLIAIGIGSEKGSTVYTTDKAGKKLEVISKLDANTLREMTNATPGGAYFNVGAETIDLKGVYRDLVSSAEKKELSSKSIERYQDKFQIFLALAFALLLIENTMGDRKRRTKDV